MTSLCGQTIQSSSGTPCTAPRGRVWALSPQKNTMEGCAVKGKVASVRGLLFKVIEFYLQIFSLAWPVLGCVLGCTLSQQRAKQQTLKSMTKGDKNPRSIVRYQSESEIENEVLPRPKNLVVRCPPDASIKKKNTITID